MSVKTLTLRPLNPEDAVTISFLLSSQTPEYLRFFYAFGADESEITKILSDCREDLYSGIFWRGDLVGFFMLRGWDDGYAVPSFGVLIDEKFRGGPFMHFALNAAKMICRLSGVSRMMAKIHPENVSVRGASRLGLQQTGVEESTGNIIYHLEL